MKPAWHGPVLEEDSSEPAEAQLEDTQDATPAGFQPAAAARLDNPCPQAHRQQGRKRHEHHEPVAP